MSINKIIELQASSVALSVEKLISSKADTVKLREYRSRFNEYIKALKSINRKILQFISDTCFKFDREEAVVILGEFVKAISEKGYPIYTTNYDHAFEHVATEKEIRIHDNFIKKGQRSIWNDKIIYELADGLTIIKLHGSVTWYIDKSGTIEKIDLDTNKNLRGADITRIVIFPTRFKDIYAQHFFALYSKFLDTLASAKVLFVIGHSLRDEYLRAGIVERYRSGDLRIVFIDPELPDEIADELPPARLGKAGPITHIKLPFQEFSDELSHILNIYETSDVPDGCAEVLQHIRARSNKIRISGKIGSLKPNTNKQFEIKIDAYLKPKEKPSYIRVWLSAKYNTAEGVEKTPNSKFLDDGIIIVGDGPSGMVKESIPINIRVPNFPEWVKFAQNVTLNVAIVKSAVKGPKNLTDDAIIAISKRELMYS